MQVDAWELILQRLALASYGVASVLAFVSMIAKARRLKATVPLIAAFGLVCQLHAVVPMLVSEGASVANIEQVLSVLVIIAVTVYLYGHWRHGLHVLGVVLLPLAMVLDLVSGVLPARTFPVSQELRDPLLVFHISVSTLGVGALFITFAFAVIYLVQERALKHKRPVRLVRLPSLNACDRALYASLVVGFALMTVGLVAAAVWSANFRGTFQLWQNQREVIGLISWAIFAALLYARLIRGWQGRRAAVLAIAGFAAVMVRLLSYRFF